MLGYKYQYKWILIMIISQSFPNISAPNLEKSGDLHCDWHLCHEHGRTISCLFPTRWHLRKYWQVVKSLVVVNTLRRRTIYVLIFSKVTESSSVVSFVLGPMFLRFLFSGAAKFMTAPGVPLHRLQLQGVQ